MKSIAYLILYIQRPYIGYPQFLQENLDPPIYDFSKIPTPYNKGMFHTMKIKYDLMKQS